MSKNLAHGGQEKSCLTPFNLGLGAEFTATTANDVYEAVQETSAAVRTLFGTSKFQISGVSNARNDLSAFLSLYYLVPFSIKPTDAGAMDKLYQLHATIAEQWNDDRNLTEKQRANGAANFSDQYLTDRAAMLKWVLKSNLDDTFGRAEGLEAIYEDKESGINLSPIIVSNTPKVMFGANDADAIAGSNQDDHLYGGGNDDDINAGDGNDYLEGNAGADTLNGEKGNDILIGGAEVDIHVGGDDYLNSGEGNYLRCAIKLLSASLIRVCQPCPSDLKYANTSASKRTEIATLVCAAALPRGRPRIGLSSLNSSSLNSYVSGSAAIPALINTSSSGVGIMVPILSLGITIHLSRISLTQADNAAHIATVHKYHTKQTQSNISKTNHTQLGIILPHIRFSPQSIPLQLLCQLQTDTMFSNISIIFSSIKLNQHYLIVYSNKYQSKLNMTIQKTYLQQAANDNKWSLAA